MGIHKNSIIIIIAIIRYRKTFSKLCTDYVYFCEDLAFYVSIASAADPIGPAV
jgi:hypothetical protein